MRGLGKGCKVRVGAPSGPGGFAADGPPGVAVRLAAGPGAPVVASAGPAGWGTLVSVVGRELRFDSAAGRWVLPHPCWDLG